MYPIRPLAADQQTLCCWEFVTVTHWGSVLNNHECKDEWSFVYVGLKRDRISQIFGRERKRFQGDFFFFFPETATWQTYHEVSLTGDKCLHSPSDIFCLSLAFTSPPLPLLRSYFNPLTPEVVSVLLWKTIWDSFGFFRELQRLGSLWKWMH